MPAKVETTPVLPGLSPVGGKPVVARFDSGHLCSDGGLLVLREVERRLDVAGRLAAHPDPATGPHVRTTSTRKQRASNGAGLKIMNYGG